MREGSGVLGQRLDPSKVHDLRNPYQARGRGLLHPHPAVEQIPFTLLYFLESLEPTDYRGEIRHLEAKIDKAEYKERDESPAFGKRLCTKVNSLLQDFSVIRGKLEVQRAFASLLSVSREKRALGPSHESVDRAGGGQSSGRARPRRQSSFVGARSTKVAPLHRHQNDNQLLEPPRCQRLQRLALLT